MSQNPYAPRFKDQADSVAAERRPPPNRDPDGMLLAAEEGSPLAAMSHKVSTDRQAKTAKSHNGRAPPSAAEAAATIMAFDVVAVEDTTTRNNNNNNNDIVPNINKSNSNEPAAPPQSNHDHPQKSFPWKTLAVVVIVIAAIVGVVVGVVSGGTSADASSETSPAETGNGDNTSPPTTMASTTPSPVVSPSPTPPPNTMAPTTPSSPTPPPNTMAPTNPSPVVSPPPTSNRPQDITNFINWNSYMGVNLLPTGTFPEELALYWLIYDDPLELNVGTEVEEFRLLQRYSLLTLWFQGGTETTWIDSTNWLIAEEECTWFGIICQPESGVVTEVHLSENGLQGTLSPDLGLLTDLTVFGVADNSVSGSLPSEIGLWTSLNEFYVYGNALAGSLPSEIGLWINLERFDVSVNALAGSLTWEFVGLWTNLEGFWLNDNILTGSLPSEIGLWTNLDIFDVSVNALTGTIPATIANWKLIMWAHFQNNNFSGSMPNGICEFITEGTDPDLSDELWADCDEVTCSCCTKCW